MAGPPNCAPTTIYSGSNTNETHQVATELKIVSLNMARETQVDKILDNLKQAESLASTDVWLLQEVAERPASGRKTIPELAQALKLNYVFVPADSLEGGELISGLAIMSRFPLVDPRVIPLARNNNKINTRCRIALETQIEGPFGPIEVYNVHLDTRITRRQRMEQIRPILDSASSLNRPVIVAGDFNTANIRWIWNVLPIPFAEKHGSLVEDAFLKRGFTSPLDPSKGTINMFPISLRLDWIFPRGLDPLSAGVEPIKFSDHDAVWVRLSAPGSAKQGAVN
jgi:endonuclease/exonuclease/phosphatase family metal-dependent hydrolase